MIYLLLVNFVYVNLKNIEINTNEYIAGIKVLLNIKKANSKTIR